MISSQPPFAVVPEGLTGPQPTHAPGSLRTLTAGALAAATLALTACGGGSAEPPPSGPAPVVDTTPPVMTMTDNVAATEATGDVTFTFSFNEDVGTSFTVDDVTVVGGTKGAFTRLGGTSATLVVTPAPNSSGNLDVSVAAGRFTDAAGNANAATSTRQAYNTVIPVVLTRLVSFDETTAPVLTGFGGAEDATIAADPSNAANKVAKVVKSATAEVWAGVTVSICANQTVMALPFSSTLTTLAARVWSPTAGTPVRMKVEDASDGTKSVETEAVTTVANGWQTLNFNFANQATGTAALNLATRYNKASVFFNFGTNGASAGARTYYLDDLSWVGSSFTVVCPAPTPVPPPTLSGDTTSINMDEATPPVLTGFGGAEDSTVVVDPTNAANKVAKVVKGATAEVWAGTTVSNRAGMAIAPVGFTATSKTVLMRVWSPTAGTPVRLKLESATDPTKSVETEANTTVAGGWQTLSFNFANPASGTAALNLATVYNKASVFFNFGTGGAAAGGAKTYYFDDLVYPAAAVVTPPAASNHTITMDEAAAPTLTGFGGAEDSSLVADPSNGANKVVKVIKSATAEVWAGTTVSNLAGNAVAPIGFTATNKSITVRVWSPTAGTPVRLKAENATDGSKSVETEATTTVAAGWQTLSFNFANPATGTPALNLATVYNKLSIFFNFGTGGAAAGGARTYYFEDIVYPMAAATTPPTTPSFTPITFDAAGVVYTLTGFGGAEDASLQNDPAGGVGKVARVIKSAGAETWAGATVSTGAGLSIGTVPFSATAKTITVRVYAPASGKPVRLKLEDATDPTRSVETEAMTTAANAWQTLSFNFANQATGTAALNLSYTFNKASIFFNFGTGGAAGAGTWYFDDVAFVP
jgi:Bacterial Ig-like domain